MQIRNRKEVESINNTLKHFKCSHCCEADLKEDIAKNQNKSSPTLNVKLIGHITTVFDEKRGVPRQANIAHTTLSRIDLCKDIYTNPEQSLETLDEFSHFWIIYNFHRNDSHLKPKVSPPRLDGKKVGVFATRSPHRPNPIGMSLVKLDKIEGSTIYFYGSDMVNGTPVIDIKPYIPSYDSTLKQQDDQASSLLRPREEPEGEEEHNDDVAGAAFWSNPQAANGDVKVPFWISIQSLLKVIFSDNALLQIQELAVNQNLIREILENDPRSVYVREKYLSQIYNFQVDGHNVICKFDDKSRTVTVLQVRKLLNMTASK